MEILKSNKETVHIPVIFLTSLNDAASKLKGLGLGATDFITKPFSPLSFLKRMEQHFLIES